MPSATIKIFLAHGDPKRLRTAELSSWTGKAVAGPRSEFDSVLARDAGRLDDFIGLSVELGCFSAAAVLGTRDLHRPRFLEDTF